MQNAIEPTSRFLKSIPSSMRDCPAEVRHCGGFPPKRASRSVDVLRTQINMLRNLAVLRRLRIEQGLVLDCAALSVLVFVSIDSVERHWFEMRVFQSPSTVYPNYVSTDCDLHVDLDRVAKEERTTFPNGSRCRE